VSCKSELVLHRLSDGTRVLIRPIQAEDKARLEVGLARLSAETIHRRFLAAKPRFSRSELRYLTEIDGYDHIALVAVLFDDPETLIAVARCVRLPDRPATAEMAIVVGDRFQGLGLGTLMARRLSAAARSVGIRHFAGTMLPENEPVRRLMLHIARALEDDRLDGGVREMVVELADTSAHALAA
jgi:RimJ/RimL family protein N-acetyltransferase